MATFYVKNEQIHGESISILGEDVKHIRDVLRCKITEKIDVCDEMGVRYQTQIEEFLKEEIRLKILQVCEETTEPSVNITLFQALPKADKMEWIIQKGTELGINVFIPVITERVIVKLEGKNISPKIERWNKIALEAAKQSGRQSVPEVKMPIKIQNLVEILPKYDILLLPYECEKENTIKSILQHIGKTYRNIAVFIGPEGGFSEEEIQALSSDKVKVVSLGPRILRTETAGIVAVAMILYELDM